MLALPCIAISLSACATRLPQVAPPPCQTSIPASILEADHRPAPLATDDLRGRTPEYGTLLDRDAEWESAFTQQATVENTLIGLIADANRCSAAARARD
jgi:hypothetical protein